MPRFRTAVAACAVAVGMALTVAACGSGGGGDKGAIKGSSGNGGSSKSASPSAAPSQQAGAPTIKLPADFKLDYTGWTATGNATKDAVLKDVQGYIASMSAARAYHDVKNGPYLYYTDLQATADARDEIKRFETTDGGATITGTDRYYKNDVALVSASIASVSYCEDQNKAYSKVIKTGKVLRTPQTTKDYVFTNLQVQKSTNGVWKTVKVTYNPGAVQCQ
ncbi:hypothetical protein BIV57_22535 [Mangrovactinospora gilvigrisea]|uniref:Lipoprotein n=1 Tax=Mangrovactinospora gilvigrisea TaxID=1428644 RepID=A0A1J7B9E2_9ACTN|nr:hypothetical protein BIV57_22535 [Mangrovactinospora gilvigrisea]